MSDSDIPPRLQTLGIIMRNISKPILFGGGAVLTAVLAFVAFGIFGVHTLVIDNEVSEANPFAVEATAEPASQASTDTAEADTADADAEAEATDTEADAEATDTEAAESEAAEPDSDEAPAEEAATPEILTVTTGNFISNSRYTTVGTGLTITDGNQTFLRFEGFETNNGPDLNVYLRNSENPDDYIDLGDLSGNIGDQNYLLPDGIDLDQYDLVDIWCVRFGVSFGTAQLATA